MDKRCSECKTTKPLDAFKRHAGTADGYGYVCMDCLRARRRSPAPRTPEEKRERQLALIRERHRTDPEYRQRHTHARLKSAYGILPEQYQALLDAQDGVCAICHGLSTDGRALHVDHDPATGAIRGLLCFHHNAGLGHFDHDPKLLLAAVRYLQAPPAFTPGRPVRVRVRAECGTMSGYTRHARAGEAPCDACLRAKREYEKTRRAERAAGRPLKRRKVAECGTTSGYVAHYNRGEAPCDACREAMRQYHANRRKTR